VNTWAVIATGASLNPDPIAVVSRVRHLPCVAVNDAFRIAPWARVLVAADEAWIRKNPDAIEFAGEKWCNNETRGTFPRLPKREAIYTNTNSGLLGLVFAMDRGAERILLLGVDMKGTHYFGRYRNGLVNSPDEPGRFEFFIKQFRDFAPRIRKGVEVINCNPDSALDVFPKMTLDEALEIEAIAA